MVQHMEAGVLVECNNSEEHGFPCRGSIYQKYVNVCAKLLNVYRLCVTTLQIVGSRVTCRAGGWTVSLLRPSCAILLSLTHHLVLCR